MTGQAFIIKSSLFKGLSTILGKYNSDLINNLIKKFDELKVNDYENISGSTFCKAVFFMQEDQKENQQAVPIEGFIKKADLAESKFDKNSNSGFFAGSGSPRKNAARRNKQLKEDLETEKTKLIKTKGTLGRGALREKDEYEQMFNLETRDPSKLQNLDRIELMKGKVS